MATRRSNDALDAVLAGTAGDDHRDIVAIVDDLTAAYIPDEPVALRADVLRFTNASIPASATAPPARHRARTLAAVAAFVATIAGKVAIATAVAAATLGGLHATETVEVPFLPDVGRSTPAPVEIDRDAPPGEPQLPATPDPGRSERPAPETTRPGVQPDPGIQPGPGIQPSPGIQPGPGERPSPQRSDENPGHTPTTPPVADRTERGTNPATPRHSPAPTEQRGRSADVPAGRPDSDAPQRSPGPPPDPSTSGGSPTRPGPERGR